MVDKRRPKNLEDRSELSEDWLATSDRLHDEANSGDHSQTAILHFFELEFLEITALAHVEGIKTKVGAFVVGMLESAEFDEADDEDDLDPGFNGNSVDGLEWVGFGIHRVR